MATRLISVVFDAADPARLARFWMDALGWDITVDEPEEIAVESRTVREWGDGGTPCLTFVPVDDRKTGKNRVHLDLVSASSAEQREIVARLLGLGAQHVDIGQGEVPWVVLADPEGNELCVLEPRGDYAGIRDVAAVVVDCADPPHLAEFWSLATGWSVVDASARFAALQHPTASTTRLELVNASGQKLTKNRLHVDVAPYPKDHVADDIGLLERMGARRIDIGQGAVTWTVLADPEGNEFCVLSPR